MPIDLTRYPDNWKELSLSVKEKSNWCCSCCGKKCYKPGEIPPDLTRSEWSGAILQTHHRDFNCSNNSLSNLTSLYRACNLNVHKSLYRSVSPGQLRLF
ncbi:MAG: HNH endonuclease [Pleurocapsa sp. MO_192.B19]|nr:HNH endonuclease [Pleurocapsa sp. MO_192.B19]